MAVVWWVHLVLCGERARYGLRCILLLVWLPSLWRDCRLGWLRRWVLLCRPLMLQLLLEVS